MKKLKAIWLILTCHDFTLCAGKLGSDKIQTVDSGWWAKAFGEDGPLNDFKPVEFKLPDSDLLNKESTDVLKPDYVNESKRSSIDEGIKKLLEKPHAGFIMGITADVSGGLKKAEPKEDLAFELYVLFMKELYRDEKEEKKRMKAEKKKAA